MADTQTIEAPDQVEQQTPQPPDYTSKVYHTLKDNIDGFDKDETTFRKMITTDPLYRAKVYKTLQENIEGFDKKPEVFDSSIGVAQAPSFGEKLKAFQEQERRASTQPGYKPGVMPVPEMTADKVKELNDKMTKDAANHAKQVVQARENLKKIHDNITPVAQTALKEDLEQKALSEGQSRVQQLGSDASRVAGVPLPGQNPEAPEVTPEMLQQYKDNPGNKDYLLYKQLEAYKKEGNSKAAGQLQADAYTDAAAERTTAAGKQDVALNNAKRLKKGELQYSPISKTLVEPIGFGASIDEGQANRIKDRALFNLADRGDKEALMKQLDEEIQHDPDEPVKVPKNFIAHAGSFIGEQAIPGIATGAVQFLPGVGQAAGTAIQSEEMATRGFSGELRRTYADLIAKGVPKEEALDKALTQAKTAMTIDAVTGAVLGKGVGNSAIKSVEPAAANMLKNAVIKGLKHIKEEIPASLVNAGIFSAAQVGKNVTANLVGDERSLGEGAFEAGGMALLLHHSVGLISKGLYESPGIMKRLLQGTSKAPITELKNISDNLVQDGAITPDEAQKGLATIDEHKALDAQVPDKVKNDEVRLDLQKKIQRRQDLEAELKTVNKAFHPEVKEKIAALDEKMNEIANSDEAKKETPEIKPTHNEQSTETGQRPEVREPEKQTKPPTGNIEPSGISGQHRPEEVRSEENGAPGSSGQKVTFKTSKGSTYEVNENNTTTRNKTVRKGEKGGMQEPSEKTYYVSKEDMAKLDLVQATPAKEDTRFVIGERSDGKIGVGVKGGKDNNKLVQRTIVTPKTEPEVGLHPLEIWKGGSEHHFGNEITEVIKPEDNAKAIRSDTGQVREGGETAKGSEDLSSENIQSPAEPAPVNAKTKQQTRKIASKEELTTELKKTGLSDDEKFVLKNSFPEYKKKNPEVTQDEYNVKRSEAYKKQVALRSAHDKLQGEPIEVNGKLQDVNQYVGKAKAVLQHLFPGRELTVHETEAEYMKQEQRPEGSMGVAQPDGRIALNLERIRKAGAENTVFHEVIHPIVAEALLSKSTEANPAQPKLDAAYSRLVSIKDIPGMDAIWKHENLYRDRGLAIMKTEAITEFLAHVADGKIDPTKMSLDFKTRIVDAVNRILKALGSSKVIATAKDLRRLADSVKESFAKADARPVEAALGSKREVPAEGNAMEKLDAGSEEEKQIKAILARTQLPEADVREALLNAGHDEATINRLMAENKEEQAKGPEQLIREAHTQGEAAKKAAKLAPPQDTRIAKASVLKTAKRWFYDKQDEVTDVKSVIRTNKGKEEHELDMIYKASNKARDFWNTVPKEKREAFILGMERPDLQKNWSQDERDMATVYHDRLQKTFDVIKTAMPDLNFIEDYFPHFWKKPDEVKNFFASAAAKAPLEGSKGFSMKRSFDNVLPGIQKGYDLVTTNPEELVRLAEANAWKFKTARSIFDDMKKLGYLKFSTAKDLPADWKGVEDKLFNRMGAYVTKEGDAQVAKGQYMMPPEVAKLMNDYLSVSHVAAPIKNVVQKYNTIKNTFQLGMGGFHFVTTSVESLINGVTTGVQKISTGKPANMASGAVDLLSTATILPNIAQRITRGLKARSDYYKGLQTADVMNLIAVNAKVGRQKMYSLDTWYNTKKAFNAVRVDKDFSQIPKLLWNGVLSVPEAINKPLMEHWVPALKVGGYLKSLESEIASRGNMSPRELQQAREKIWDSMDDRLGQVVYDNVFINKTAKDLAFMAIRSAGWTGGTIRTAFKGIGEIPLSGSRLIKGKGLSQRTADLIAMPLTVGFFGGMYHYLMTGAPPEELKDYFYPKDGTKNPDGTDRRVTLPSYMKDYVAYFNEPLTTLSHKTSPIVNDLLEVMPWTNKDFYGEKIYNPDDPIFKQGLDVLKHQAETMLPFSLKGNPKDIPRSTKQKTEQGFGLMEAPKVQERSETQNAIMKAFVKQLGGPGSDAKTHEQMEQYIARRHLKEYLFNGTDWEDLPDDMKEKANIKDVQKFIREAKIDPYENYFKGLHKETKQELFDAMPEDDQEKYKKYIKP